MRSKYNPQKTNRRPRKAIRFNKVGIKQEGERPPRFKRFPGEKRNDD